MDEDYYPLDFPTANSPMGGGGAGGENGSRVVVGVAGGGGFGVITPGLYFLFVNLVN